MIIHPIWKNDSGSGDFLKTASALAERYYKLQKIKKWDTSDSCVR